MLYLVPTPIGNLKDITLRALEVFQQVDVILAEDTRTTGKLLNHYQVQTPLSPYHQHNEHKILQHLVDQLLAGKKMAVVTDAGTPGISDPAFLLVRECVKNGITVESLPGATAFVPALINSGLPTNRFAFEGFIPLKKGRHTLLTELATEQRTMIFYESPVRLVKTLEDFGEYFGMDRKCAVSRELTKMFEENVRGTLEEVASHFRKKTVKGEIVIVIEGKG
jgi:16S rRNA (cytidine1402-2'-O)-methyltransferase